jgi:hypothetical protein
MEPGASLLLVELYLFGAADFSDPPPRSILRYQGTICFTKPD